MTDAQFWKIVNDIVSMSKGNPIIMTGLPSIDNSNDTLRHTRALEIVEKINNLYSTWNDTEKKSVEWFFTGGWDPATVKTQLGTHRAEMLLAEKKKSP